MRRLREFREFAKTPLFQRRLKQLRRLGLVAATDERDMIEKIRKIGPGIAVITTGLFFSSCDVDKTKDGKMPSVDVDVKGDAGALPEFEVRAPKITTGTKKVEVEVPTVDVEIPKENDNE